MSRSDVAGALCSDQSALTICSRGTLDDSLASTISEIFALSASLESDSDNSSVNVDPVIILNASNSTIAITNQGNVTVAVHYIKT